MYELYSFLLLAQVHSDALESDYDLQRVQARREEDEADKMKWSKVKSAKAYAMADKTNRGRRKDEQQEEFDRLAREAQHDWLYLVNYDHLGTPQEVDSEVGKVVWLAREVRKNVQRTSRDYVNAK